MTKSEGETHLHIGKLIAELCALEKNIGKLRDEIAQRATTFARVGRRLVSQPERLVFEGQSDVDEQFAGEPVIDRKAMDVDSLLAELRAAIVRKKECTVELAELGIDLEEAEREHNLRLSRALLHPANVRHGSEDGEAKREDKRNEVGFVPRKRRGS
jgi:hypothetical protein